MTNNKFMFRIWWASHQKYLDNRMFITMPGGKIWAGMTIPVLPSEENDFEVEFFTGFFDKNKKPIYDGDILEISSILKPSDKHNATVNWDPKRGAWIVYNWHNDRIDMLSGHLDYLIEVVGNRNEKDKIKGGNNGK